LFLQFNHVPLFVLIDFFVWITSLHAVVYHRGRSAASGHYIASVRDYESSASSSSSSSPSSSSKWVRFDDSFVDRVRDF
jgi:hypothetical protein